MAVIKLSWTQASKVQFENLRTRATAAGRFNDLVRLHNEIITSLRDPAQAVAKGEILFKTKKEGGQVRHWVHGFISVVYAIFPLEQAGWITKYQPTPDSWPD